MTKEEKMLITKNTPLESFLARASGLSTTGATDFCGCDGSSTEYSS